MKQMIIAGLLIILLSLPISNLIARNIAKPLKQLEQYSKRIAGKDWESELNIKRQDEIGKLAQSMREMKEALKMADEEERKFLQSISHDLKTPVMLIASYAAAINDKVYDESPKALAQVIQAEASRLEKKIKQILYLNTLDYVMENEKDNEDVYLHKLLPYLVANFQAVNSELTWQLQTEPGPAVIAGSPERIRVSIENILENQLRFAKSAVRITLKETETCWIIEITNDGPPLSEDDLSQLFGSLYKGVRGNFGLGLSISGKIVHFYRGTVKAENRQDAVCFTIRYPKK